MTVAISVSLDEKDAEFVQQVARARGWSRSQVIREALAKLRADPVVFLTSTITDSNHIKHGEAQ